MQSSTDDVFYCFCHNKTRPLHCTILGQCSNGVLLSLLYFIHILNLPKISVLCVVDCRMHKGVLEGLDKAQVDVVLVFVLFCF